MGRTDNYLEPHERLPLVGVHARPQADRDDVPRRDRSVVPRSAALAALAVRTELFSRGHTIVERRTPTTRCSRSTAR
mgnify:CR=1 FL=1